MDYTVCNVIYVDRTAGEDRVYRRSDFSDQPAGDRSNDARERGLSGGASESRVTNNIRTLLGTFVEVQVCRTGKSCLLKLADLHEISQVDATPTLVLIDVPYNDAWEETHGARTPSPMSSRQSGNDAARPDDSGEKFYGVSLLQWITSDIHQNHLSKLFVPVVLVAMPTGTVQWPLTESKAPEPLQLDQKRTMRYLDLGAVDVTTSPVSRERLSGLAIHAYRAHKNVMKEEHAIMELKRGRKRSWVGLDDQKPYAYLREAMVSGLMDGICRLEPEDLPSSRVQVNIEEGRQEKVKEAISTWHFSAHDFTDDELLHAAILMLQHALSMPELEQWRIPTESLTGFLVACRSAYNSFVPYHNFRHVIDVLQACFHFLVKNGTLPPYPAGSATPIPAANLSPIAALMKPFDALTLLITAIGHDVGHPGVNNAFLIKLNAPLAQLYNDRSVLESFHCAAYSQILRRHWPSAFSAVEMRQLMISSILATDMGLHFDYMKKLGFLEEKLDENKGTDGWNGRTKEEYRTLACSLIIKCADISNVARRYDVAAKWTMILTDEFARQASMERDLSIPSALFAPPVREIIELGQSQIGFMNMFAIPLFQNVTTVLPEMQFCVDELQKNRKIWEDRIEYEQAKKRKDSEDSLARDGAFSPRQMSLASPAARRNNSLLSIEHIPSVPSNYGLPRGSVVFSKSPLASPSGNDPNFSNFRALTDIPSEDATKGSVTVPDSLIPPAYAFPDATSKSTSALNEGGPQVENASMTESRALSEPTLNKSDAVNPNFSFSQHDALADRTNSPLDPAGSTCYEVAPKHTDDTSESQATSATTNKIPRSPSTKGTSVNSLDNDDEAASNTPTTATTRNSRPNMMTTNSSNSSSYPVSVPTSSAGGGKPWLAESGGLDVPTGDSSRATSRSGERGNGNENDEKNGLSVGGKLVKKTSRSRFKFWKKRNSIPGDRDGGTPPMPATE